MIGIIKGEYMMKKTLIMFTILISVIAAGIIKAGTKQRVYQLENRVVNLSKSERKAWDTIAQLNAKLNKMERTTPSTRKLAEYDEEEGIVEDYGDDEDDEDEEDGYRRATKKPSHR